MTSSQHYDLFLSCTYSGFPGDEWDAWVGFEQTKEGFSVWAGGSNPDGDGPSSGNIATCSQQLTWREACKVLLRESEGAIFGDFRADISVEGADGVEAELLALCWMKEDDISTDIKGFLIALCDEDLNWLEEAVDDELTTDESLKLIGLYLDLDVGGKSPRALCSKYLPTAKKHQLEKLIKVLEKEESDRAALMERDIQAKLQPFSSQISQILLMKFPATETELTEDEQRVEQSQHSGLSDALSNFVLTNERLPSDTEISDIWNDIKSKPVAVMKWGKGLYYLNVPPS